MTTPTITQALWFLPFCLPIALWVSYTDLKYMKIRNNACLAMIAAYAVVGWPALGLHSWLWGWAIMAIVLVFGFFGNAVGLFGAGDAKFGAAMAGVFSGGDPWLIAMLYAGCSIAALLGQRIARMIPLVRRASPDWVSWSSKKFPMGLALALMLILYLLAAFLPKG
ncbi:MULTISPECIES: prepilin peptidase [Paracoccaceae]|uniref:prepilin peptidase n=1 Tax=Paracoccaceae TaxID=31989 RepID=UPI0018E7505B|nr:MULTISPECIES: A24 family peptidase [Paracoccaceae]MBJ2151844.1 prepilin peptidase [Paracoccus sp. IB05]